MLIVCMPRIKLSYIRLERHGARVVALADALELATSWP
jgi:hypothetical protein